MQRKTKVLFVSYYFFPYPGVGAARNTYWATHMTSIDPTVTCDVITATPPGQEELDGIRRRHYVPPGGWSPRKLLVRDEGCRWARQLRRAIRRRPEQFDHDVAIISGGPFMHFGIARQLKVIFGSRVILDFRDPFARNPRFKNSRVKTIVKSAFERRFLRAADHVLTVNDYCIRLLADGAKSLPPYTVIDNGYDETRFHPTVSRASDDTGAVRLIYAGKIYPDCSSRPLLNVLAEDENQRVSLHYLGHSHPDVDDYALAHNIHLHGWQTPDQALTHLRAADVCVIFASGRPFQSTTKVFDYIGLEKPILIITAGEPRTGALHDITRDYPCVFWARNRYSEIAAALTAIRSNPLRVDYPNREIYSRRRGAERLLRVIHGLTARS